MQSLDDMSVHDAIALYYEKHHAMRQGDMKKLLELKKNVLRYSIKKKMSKYAA